MHGLHYPNRQKNLSEIYCTSDWLFCQSAKKFFNKVLTFLYVHIIITVRTRKEVKQMSRPKSDKSKNMRFEIRINSETADKLQYCAEKMGTTKSDVIHKGIDLVKAELDKKK